MEEIKISEPKEAVIVLIAEVGSAVIGFLTAAPIPVEWKAPSIALAGAIVTSITAYWYAKINKPE